MLGLTAALLAVLVSLWLVYARWRHQYWQRLGVYAPPGNPLLGHLRYTMSFGVHRHEFLDESYRSHRGDRFTGLYEILSPHISIHDMALIQAVLVKDFDHFVDRRTFEFNHKVFDDMLGNAKGSHWKGLRSVMTPTFTSGKMKTMFPLIVTKANSMVDYCMANKDQASGINVKDLFDKYTIDIIGSCAFGLDINALHDDNKEFRKSASSIFTMNFLTSLKFFVLMGFPKMAKLLNVSAASSSFNYLLKTMEKVLADRKFTERRGDFVDLIMDAKKSSEQEDKKTPKFAISDDTIISQAVLFIVAGFDTTANSLTITAFLLAKHPACQDTLREELRQRLALSTDSELSYSDVMDTPYLDAVFAESLRLYPAAPFLERQCTRDYPIPGSSVVIPAGMTMSVPIWSLHHDPLIFDNPEEFQPERFLPENKKSIPPFAYLPFGAGPRMCIAQRFALMEAKLALAKLVLNFRMSNAKGFEELEFQKQFGTLRPSARGVRVLMEKV